MSQAERLQQQTLSAYSYSLTQFLSKEQLDVMAQMQTTQMPECVSDRTIPRPATRRRKAYMRTRGHFKNTNFITTLSSHSQLRYCEHSH
jgi:hypothetical protein